MGASGDLDRVNVLAALVSGSEEEAHRLVDVWKKKAEELSKRPAFRKAVETLVPRILEKKTLNGDEVHDIVERFLDEDGQEDGKP